MPTSGKVDESAGAVVIGQCRIVRDVLTRSDGMHPKNRTWGWRALQGKTRTEFMLEASREKAEQVLLDQTLFTVNAKQYKAFVALMEAPLAKNAGLKRLFAKRAPWDK